MSLPPPNFYNRADKNNPNETMILSHRVVYFRCTLIRCEFVMINARFAAYQELQHVGGLQPSLFLGQQNPETSVQVEGCL